MLGFFYFYFIRTLLSSSHWKYEVEKFCGGAMTTLLYAGNQRKQSRAQILRSDIVVLSYDVLRNEIDFFEQFNFSYCILDEGHIIKVCLLKMAKHALTEYQCIVLIIER